MKYFQLLIVLLVFSACQSQKQQEKALSNKYEILRAEPTDQLEKVDDPYISKMMDWVSSIDKDSVQFVRKRYSADCGWGLGTLERTTDQKELRSIYTQMSAEHGHFKNRFYFHKEENAIIYISYHNNQSCIDKGPGNSTIEEYLFLVDDELKVAVKKVIESPDKEKEGNIYRIIEDLELLEKNMRAKLAAVENIQSSKALKNHFCGN